MKRIINSRLKSKNAPSELNWQLVPLLWLRLALAPLVYILAWKRKKLPKCPASPWSTLLPKTRQAAPLSNSQQNRYQNNNATTQHPMWKILSQCLIKWYFAKTRLSAVLNTWLSPFMITNNTCRIFKLFSPTKTTESTSLTSSRCLRASTSLQQFLNLSPTKPKLKKRVKI